MAKGERKNFTGKNESFNDLWKRGKKEDEDRRRDEEIKQLRAEQARLEEDKKQRIEQKRLRNEKRQLEKDVRELKREQSLFYRTGRGAVRASRGVAKVIRESKKPPPRKRKRSRSPTKKKSYYCRKCKLRHNANSKIGRKHRR